MFGLMLDWGTVGWQSGSIYSVYLVFIYIVFLSIMQILSSPAHIAPKQICNHMVDFLKRLEVENASIFSSQALSDQDRFQLRAILKW
jgi:hypothetical protein